MLVLRIKDFDEGLFVWAHTEWSEDENTMSCMGMNWYMVIINGNAMVMVRLNIEWEKVMFIFVIVFLDIWSRTFNVIIIIF